MFCHQTYYIPKVSIVVPFVGLDIDIAIFALRVLYKLPPQNRNYNGDFRHTYIYISLYSTICSPNRRGIYIHRYTYIHAYIHTDTHIYIYREVTRTDEEQTEPPHHILGLQNQQVSKARVYTASSPQTHGPNKAEPKRACIRVALRSCPRRGSASRRREERWLSLGSICTRADGFPGILGLLDYVGNNNEMLVCSSRLFQQESISHLRAAHTTKEIIIRSCSYLGLFLAS